MNIVNIWLLRLGTLCCAVALLLFVLDWLPKDGVYLNKSMSLLPEFHSIWPQLQLPLLLLNLLALVAMLILRHKAAHTH
ncbi:hypothetical protein L9G74_12785 [Shewanella sp. C32]|uniref:Uncharacterized protein n=1 Tax=Shewanella electrica TaxID=515560 RepID=A0ABT2FLV9_9GAMM|nr:hypothetical protein [Shewanella electrica]MCH1925794.1 hypothetical protein [Shewanella electrica]MCS4557321.1 hypothetical protein [Shewanella electrica]